MNLQAFAERVQAVASPAHIVDLHVKDTLAALFAGARTGEGRALAQRYCGHADVSMRAAAAAGIARLSECDDIHLASCVTPSSVVVPVALALGGEAGSEEFHRAVSAGCAAGLRIGAAIGGAKALAVGLWPSLFVAPVMTAVTACLLRGGDTHGLAHAMALALAAANGRRPEPVQRWFAFAEAVRMGIQAADEAASGTRGDLNLLSPFWLAAQAGEAANPQVFERDLPTLSEVGFKPYPMARQGITAAMVFQTLLMDGVDPKSIDAIEVFVPTMNIALLSRPVAAEDRLSRLCNMAFQIACGALRPDLLYDTERAATVPLLDFAKRVSVKASDEFDVYIPRYWGARVAIKSGPLRIEDSAVQLPFDRDGPNLRRRLEEKWRHLLTLDEASELLNDSWHLWRRWHDGERHVTIAAQSAAPREG